MLDSVEVAVEQKFFTPEKPYKICCHKNFQFAISEQCGKSSDSLSFFSKPFNEMFFH